MLFTIIACGTIPEESSPSPLPTISNLVEQSANSPNVTIEIIDGMYPEIREVDIQIVPQDNCGGSAEVEYEFTRSITVLHVIEVEGGFEINANGELGLPGTNIELGSAIATSLGYSYGTAENITASILVKAEPGTSMEHQIKFVEIWEVGDAKVLLDDQEYIIPFSFRRNIDVELIDSTKIGDCINSVDTSTSIAQVEVHPEASGTPTEISNSIIQESTCEQIIDFETVGGGLPIEGLPISDQFYTSHGIRFSLVGGKSPVIADTGGELTAFGSERGDDMPALGQRVGDFFLTDDGKLSGLQSEIIIVSFDPPTSAASGEILDIDYSEVFTLEALDSSGIVLDTKTIVDGAPNTGDGIATPWSFEFPNPAIYSIRISGKRTTAGHFGLGFDNFSPRRVCTK